MELLTSSLPVRGPRSTGAFLAGLAAVIAMLYFGRLFFITVIVAVILAFMLDPLVSFLMRLRLPRGVSSFLTCSLALTVVYLAALAFYTQAAGLVADLPLYSDRINQLIDSVVVRLETTEKSISSIIIPKRLQSKEEKPEVIQPSAKAPRRRSAEPPAPPITEVRISQDKDHFVTALYHYMTPFYDVLLMASFVPFLVYFMLSWRDHLRRGFLQLFQGPDRMVAGKSWEGIAEMARAYVVGNFILGLLLAVASTVLFWMARLPFPLLIGPVSGFLSLIPYIGMPLALIPPFFAALPVHDKIGAYLIIGSAVAFLHLLALNLMYPKLVGARVHLNPLAVTVALMFWGTIWGPAGLVLGIPITAGVKAVCDNVRQLEPYGKLLGD